MIKVTESFRKRRKSKYDEASPAVEGNEAQQCGRAAHTRLPGAAGCARTRSVRHRVCDVSRAGASTGAQWLRGCQGLGKGSGVTANGDGDSLPEEIVGLVAQSVNVLNTIELHTLNR